MSTFYSYSRNIEIQLIINSYPNNNCAAQFNTGQPIQNPQDVFPSYLTHTAAVNLVQPYIHSTDLAQGAGKPFIMFETNTASCGGFPGISDTYGAALWAMDYGFQMAYANFTHALMHIGGQNVYYNVRQNHSSNDLPNQSFYFDQPFTSPPTNQSSFNEWTAGAVYYSTIVLAEAFGKTNTSRIIDLFGNANSVYTPSYAIYENNALSKVALFNFIDDKTGASNSQVTITVPAGAPSTVKVK